MILPPAVLRLRLLNGERRIRLWFPLVLLWPLVAAVTLAGLFAIRLAYRGKKKRTTKKGR